MHFFNFLLLFQLFINFYSSIFKLFEHLFNFLVMFIIYFSIISIICSFFQLFRLFSIFSSFSLHIRPPFLFVLPWLSFFRPFSTFLAPFLSFYRLVAKMHSFFPICPAYSVFFHFISVLSAKTRFFLNFEKCENIEKSLKSWKNEQIIEIIEK